MALQHWDHAILMIYSSIMESHSVAYFYSQAIAKANMTIRMS